MNRDHIQILVKKNSKETSEVSLTIDIMPHRRMRSNIGITVNFISNEKATKCYAALTDDPKAITQLNTL